MSNATKCDRCGACYEYGGMTVGEEYDLCDGCIADFEAWIDAGVHGENVTESPELSHDTGVSGYRYHIIRDGMMRMVVEGSDLKDTDVVESVEEPDTRELLEADVRQILHSAYMLAWMHGHENMRGSSFEKLHVEFYNLLDRQAAITERDMLDEMQHVFVPDPADITMRDERIVKLQREIATLKEHRAANVEKLHELTDECAELRKYRDEWKGLAEKYRADSIAAQEETERYRAKLGDVLDALHEAEMAAR